MIRIALCGAVLAVLASGCGRDALLRCENAEPYYDAGERPPIRVPDDLSVPDESQALRIPPPERVSGAPAADGPCLESPPRFSEDIAQPEQAATDGAAVPPS